MPMKDRLANLIAQAVRSAIQPVPGDRVPLAVSARHVHLSRQDIDTLFGKGYELRSVRPLTQPEQYVTEDFVELQGKNGVLRLRVLGPARRETQVEITRSEAMRLGIPTPPVRPSGRLEGSVGGLLRGPKGATQLTKGVIIADRHLHMSADEALFYGLKDGERIRVFLEGDRPGTMENVTVRAGDGHKLDLHIDTDDANAFGVKQGDLVRFERMSDSL